MNSTYWKNIHLSECGELGRVGHPDLSEALNRIKYESESESFCRALSEIRPGLGTKGHVKVLDVGAGTGYWSEVVYRWCASQGIEAEITALDISIEALRKTQERYPWIRTHCEDLTRIDPGLFSECFNLVITVYCLHHLVSFHDFANAMEFACRSVKKGGSLIIVDPVLTKAFSTFDIIDLKNFKGNGIVRHLYLLDDLAFRERFERQLFRPAVSFLLNGNIEANSHGGFVLCGVIWTLLRIMYVNENWTRRFGGVLRFLDKKLKAANLGLSSNVCVYRKQGSSD